MGNPESPKFDGCPMDSHFIGHGLLRTVFKITLARPEGSTPATIVSTKTKILKNHQNNLILLFFLAPSSTHMWKRCVWYLQEFEGQSKLV